MNKVLVAITCILLVTALGCITVTIPKTTTPSPTTHPTITPTPSVVNQKPVAFIDTLSPSSVAQGNTVSFSGHGTDADGFVTVYEWSSSIDGILSVQPTFSTSALSIGAHVISFKVMDNLNLWSDPVNASLVISEKVVIPAIISFTAVPSQIMIGGSSLLSWNVVNATSVSINGGVGSVASVGSTNVYPSYSTVYTLTATNVAGTRSASAAVEVVQEPSIGNPDILYFTAHYLGGTSWELNWSVSYASDAQITPGIGSVPLTGSTVINTSVTRTYTLTATNSWGWSKRYITVGYQ